VLYGAPQQLFPLTLIVEDSVIGATPRFTSFIHIDIVTAVGALVKYLPRPISLYTWHMRLTFAFDGCDKTRPHTADTLITLIAIP